MLLVGVVLLVVKLVVMNVSWFVVLFGFRLISRCVFDVSMLLLLKVSVLIVLVVFGVSILLMLVKNGVLICFELVSMFVNMK